MYRYSYELTENRYLHITDRIDGTDSFLEITDDNVLFLDAFAVHDRYIEQLDIIRRSVSEKNFEIQLSDGSYLQKKTKGTGVNHDGKLYSMSKYIECFAGRCDKVYFSSFIDKHLFKDCDYVSTIETSGRCGTDAVIVHENCKCTGARLRVHEGDTLKFDTKPEYFILDICQDVIDNVKELFLYGNTFVHMAEYDNNIPVTYHKGIHDIDICTSEEGEFDISLVINNSEYIRRLYVRTDKVLGLDRFLTYCRNFDLMIKTYGHGIVNSLYELMVEGFSDITDMPFGFNQEPVFEIYADCRLTPVGVCIDGKDRTDYVDEQYIGEFPSKYSVPKRGTIPDWFFRKDDIYFLTYTVNADLKMPKKVYVRTKKLGKHIRHTMHKKRLLKSLYREDSHCGMFTRQVYVKTKINGQYYLINIEAYGSTKVQHWCVYAIERQSAFLYYRNGSFDFVTAKKIT